MRRLLFCALCLLALAGCSESTKPDCDCPQCDGYNTYEDMIDCLDRCHDNCD
jgi:hypothetical protein